MWRSPAMKQFVASYLPRRKALFLGWKWIPAASHAARVASADAIVVSRTASLASPVVTRNRPIKLRSLREIQQETFDLVAADATHLESDRKTSFVRSLLNEGGRVMTLAGSAATAERAGQSLAKRFESIRYFVLEGRDAREVEDVAGTGAGATLCLAETRPGEQKRLHLGSGPLALPDWTNIDNRPYEGIDRLLDLGQRLPFIDGGTGFVFAEHFIEHLEYDQTLPLLSQCRRLLADEGVLRVSTPNLDWVWLYSYHPGQWSDPGEAIRDCFVTNRAFRGWGHKFLYNLDTLRELLMRAGFARVEPRDYGESPHPELRNLERHEKYPDSPDLPHVIIVEASGRAEHQPVAIVEQYLSEYRRDLATE
ncbi:MAG TPA: hypothetical protein VM534_05820 [Thermoanaerobaculia bacterium]|nr:hypothetical protein [Thermoanaerobaculia bacterium]